MMSILALLVAAVANDSMQSMKSVAQSGRDTQARYAAHAGLELALNELRKNEMFIGEEIEERHGRLEGTLVGLDQMSYEVLVWNNIQDRSEGEPDGDAEAIAGPGTILVRPDTVYLVSSGSDIVRGEEVMLSSMAGTARRIRPVFDDAAFARSKMALSGPNTIVDAWDSSTGWSGFEPYSGGSMPSSGPSPSPSPGSGSGPMSNVLNYQATLGTDGASGRTLRLLDGAELNGHYRLGPGVDDERAFGSDRGSIGSPRPGGGSTEVSYAVSTAESEDQVAGLEPATLGEVTNKYLIDSKDTEVPRFSSPFADEDVIPAPPLTGSRTRARDRNGDPIFDSSGNPVWNDPAPEGLPPGGYESISVGPNQTLELSPGVYYFRDELEVRGGTVRTVGDGPVIVFCGKKASFVNADINPDRAASHLQLCFTDDLRDEDELGRVVTEVADIFSDAGGAIGALQTANAIAPLNSEGERKGFSLLEMEGSTVSGSISGEGLVAIGQGGDIFGSIMGNVVKGRNMSVHQDVALKGSNLMAAGGWKLESVHQLR